jgi:hypothetical protein
MQRYYPMVAGKASKQEKRRYNQYFSRFAPTQQPEIKTAGMEGPMEVEKTSPQPTREQPTVNKSSTDTLKEIKNLKEILLRIEEKVDTLEKRFRSEDESYSPEKIEFYPFFNSPDNRTLESKTYFSSEGQLKMKVELANRLKDIQPIIFPFGLEKIKTTLSPRELVLEFTDESGYSGEMRTTLVSNEDGIYTLIVHKCYIKEERNIKPVNFQDLYLPIVTQVEENIV